MNKVLLLLLIFPICCPAQSNPAPKPAAPAKPTEAKPVEAESGTRQVEVLAAGIKIGQLWQDAARRSAIDSSMKLWGYSAFDGVTAAGLQDSLETQYTLLGPITYCEILTDRCLVDLQGTAPGSDGEGRGTYVTLSWLVEFQKGLRRETMMLHEPEKGGVGLKIIGLRREELPAGRQAAAELATGLGQLALLKLRGAPRDRWSPWQREAAALAEKLKVSLPAIPEAANGDDQAAGEKLAALVMTEAPPIFDRLGPGGGAPEAKAILNAFALLLLYEPGDETCTRLAVLAGTEAEKAKLPLDLWKPLIRAVAAREKFPAVHESVQRMSAGIAAHLAEQELAARLNAAPRLILDQALANMEKLPTYKVHAALTAADGRKSVMDASLAPGAMYLQMSGFDGRKDSRLVTKDGYRRSLDEGKTWAHDPDTDGAMGLCRTLQAPLDRTRKFTTAHAFALSGVEKLDGEQLCRFHSKGAGAEPAMTYWVLMSKNGPVIRRAQLQMKFGDILADALLTYTRLGKEVDIPVLEPIPAEEK